MAGPPDMFIALSSVEPNDSDSDSDDDWCRFQGQRVPPLLKYFQRVLRRYPDGGQILKELLQNADDAGATEVKFLLDMRRHSSSGLLHERLAKFQGPALYAYNNAVFSDDDWGNLMNVDQSKKEGELMKVGRFGLGFISVYHMTDFPTILSGDTVAFLDPHAQHLPRRMTGTSRSLQRILRRYHGHASTFQDVLGCHLERTEAFNGTLFRFPLRQSESQLSPTVYDANEVKRKLFASFKEESEKPLLFLKHVQVVELYERSTAHHQEDLIFRVTVSSQLQRAVARNRLRLREEACLGFQKNRLFSQTSALSTTVWSPADGQVEQHFCVVNCIDTRHHELNELGHRLNLLPWVGVACPLPKQLGGAKKMSIDSQWQEHPLLFTGGNAFCFLPLPNQTGCPVHLNGYFAVADNRRSIKWPSYDDTGEEARWNELLVEVVLSKAYAVLLKSVAEALDPQTKAKSVNPASFVRQSLAYAAWPDLHQLRRTAVWKSLVIPLADSVGTDSPVFWTAADGGQFVSLRTAWFLHNWHDADKEEKQVLHCVAKVMLAARKFLVIPPQHVVLWLNMVDKFSQTYKDRLVSPAVLRCALRDLLKVPFGKSIVQAIDIVHHLLDFILRDEDYQDIVGLPLLPMANGGFAAFTGRFSARSTPVYVPDDLAMVDLFPNLAGLFVDVSGCKVKQHLGLTGQLRKLAKSNATQLSLAGHDRVPELLLQSIKAWASLESGKPVAWTPGKNGNPSRMWLEKVWRWLTTHAKQLSLSRLSACPILPSNCQSLTVRLHVPSISSACIAPTHNSHLRKIADYLQRIGCYMMDDHAPSRQHPEFRKVVHSPKAGGILGAFCAAAQSYGRQEFIRQFSQSDPKNVNRRKLRLYFNNECVSGYASFTSDQLQLLRCLPLFDALPGGQLVAASHGYQLPPPGSLPSHVLSIPPKLLHPKGCQDSIQLLDELGLHCLDEENFILQHIVPHLKSCSAQDKVTYAMHIITRSQFLSKQGLSQSRFVPTSHNGSLVAPAELYDCTDDHLRRLFLPSENVFPCREISQSKVHIAHLRQLGLQTTADLPDSQIEEIIVERAKKMARLGETHSLRIVVERAVVLLQLLESLLERRDVTTHLKTIPWLPAEAQIPLGYPHGLKWYGKDIQSCLIAPLELRVGVQQTKYLQDDLLIGASRAMINNKLKTMCQESQLLCTYFGWDAPCQGSDVVKQLQLLVDRTMQFHGEVSDEFLEALEYNVMTIYTYLQQHWKDLPLSSLPRKWVWVGQTNFAEPERVVLQMPDALRNISLEPYRFVLPARLRKRFRYLFKEHAGIKPLGEARDCKQELLSILQEIAGVSPRLANNSAVDVYCELLQLISKSLSGSSVVVPRNDMVLCPPEMCSYPDLDSMYWLSQTFTAEEMGKYNVIHSRLSTSVARDLGVRPLSSQLITVKPLGLPVKSSLGQSYGPKETLTHRLKGILEDYPGDSTILKELVQNADDAKASEVRIMVDWRGYGSTPNTDASSLLHPNMSTWQGPAIWAYNDAEFSDADFENIVRLAGSTKEAQAGKIGRFGLGFNAVYHLTDVPSFVSRRFVSFFDPHAKYMPNHACASNPGLQIDFVNEQSELKRAFQDQFCTYEGIFGCSVLNCNSEHGFRGTLFRFPLRLEGVHSDICRAEYSPQRVQQLLTSFQEEMRNSLLFLQFIRKISIFELQETQNPSEAVLISKTELSVCSKGSTQLPENACPTSLLSQLTADKVQIEQCLQQWLTSYDKQRKSNQRSSTPPFAIYLAAVHLKENCKLLGPRSRAPSRLRVQRQRKQEFTWVVCSGAGGQQAADLAMHSEGWHYPWAGLAIPVKVTDDGTKILESLPRTDSHAYCFLPLPISTGLPFHVNSFFAVDKTRQHLCYSTSQSDQGTRWNMAIVTSTLPQLVCELLKEMRPDIPKDTPPTDAQQLLKNYFDAWPTVGSGLWDQFKKAFFKFFASDTTYPLLWTPANGGQWKAAEECIILDAHRELPGELFIMAVDVLAILSHGVILSPGDVEEQLLTVMPCQDFKWFSQVLFQNLSCIDDSKRDCLLLHMLTSDLMKEDWLVKLFRSHDCIQTTRRSLKKPAELIDLDSCLLQGLYNDEDDRFPSHVYDGQVARAALIRLGMQSDKISLEDIIEQAESVLPLSTANVEKAIQRTSNLLSYVETARLSISERKYLESKLPGIPFLPVCHGPPGQPLRWWADDQDSLFHAGKRVWPESCSAILSSQAAVLNTGLLKVKTSSKTLALCGVSLNKRVPIQLVHGQLVELVASRSLLTDLTEQQFEFFETSNRKIYKFLEKMCKSEVEEEATGKTETESAQLRQYLRKQPWIWYEGNYQPVHVFATEWQESDFLPYFCQMPKDMQKKFPHLLSTAGVKQSFLLEDYLKASQDLYEKQQDSGRKVSKRDVMLLLHLAKLIHEESVCFCDDVRNDLCNKVVLPSEQRELFYVKDLTYDDMPWIPADSLIKSRYNYLHREFPPKLAEDLGMKTLRVLCSDRLPANHSSLADDLFGEEFGQKEPLCNRLQQILRNYPADVTIFKELIQNADDCGATEIHFILDSTMYGQHSLYDQSDSWAGLQRRPALCVFNNRPFTEDDIKGISRLGRGGKRNDPSTVGCFGIGFNAVYHLTDCPMFVSRGPGGQPQNMCLFDPRCKHWPFATERSPGRHWCLTKEKEDVFPDQFAPFLKDSVHAITDTGIGSTVFRLPLRVDPVTEDEETGCISEEDWNTERILEVFMQLHSEARTILLFLNNVQKITASVKDNSDLHELFSATSTLSDSAVKYRQRFAQAVEQYSCLSSQCVRVNYQLKITQTTKDTNETKCWQELIHTIQAAEIPLHPSAVASSKRKHPATCSGQFVVCVPDCLFGTVHESWLMVQSLGVEPAAVSDEIEMLLERGWEYKLLPRGGIAVPLAGMRLGDRGRAYTFLPLPITTGLPVHVNADFVLDDGRRFISRSSRPEDIDNIWNDFVLSEIVPELYTQTLCLATCNVVKLREDGRIGEEQRAKDSLKERLEWFYSLFPKQDCCTSPQWKQVASVVYQKLAGQHAEILSTQTKITETQVDHEVENAPCDNSALEVKWVPVTGEQQGIFHCLKVTGEKNECSVINLLLKCGMKLTSAPVLLRHEFILCEMGGEVSMLTPTSACDFFRSLACHCSFSDLPFAASCDIDELFRNVLTLLTYCLSDVWSVVGGTELEHQLDRHLEGLPLLLTADGHLRSFCKDEPVFRPKYARLLSHIPHKFMDDQLWEKMLLLDTSTLKCTIHNSKIIIPLSVAHLAKEVSTLQLPMEAQQGRVVVWDEVMPSINWLSFLWRFILDNQNLNGGWNDVYSACEQFSIIPTTTGRLMPLCQAMVIFQPQSGSIPGTMKEMGCPFSNFASILGEDAGDVDRYLRIYGNLALANNPAAVIRCLLAVEESDGLNTNLDPGRLDELLSHLLDAKISDHDKASMRRLPLYPTTDGQRVALRGANVYFWPEEMPQCGLDPDQLAKKGDVTLLDPCGHVSRFIRSKLEVTDIDVAELYSKYLFEQLQEMSHKDVCQHLEFIHNELLPQDFTLKMCYDRHPYAEQLFNNLKTLPFVTVQECPGCEAEPIVPGECTHAFLPSQLFDPNHAVFAVRLNKTQFPHQKWLHGPWKRFLELLGLQRSLPQDMFLQCIDDVHSFTVHSGRAHPGDDHWSTSVNWRELSNLLFVNLFTEQLNNLFNKSGQNQNLLENSTAAHFLQQVGQVAFIFRQDQFPCVEQIQNLLQKEDLPQLTAVMRNHNLISFQGSILYRNAPLAWSTCPVLPQVHIPEELLPKSKKVFQLLGVQARPGGVAVAKHLVNLCRSVGTTTLRSDVAPCERPKQQLCRQLNRIYERLNAEESDDAHGQVIDVLQGIPCIIINDEQSGCFQFVLASQLCKSIEEEIRPAYLLQVPSQYQCYNRLFRSLGTTDRPTSGQYAGVLRILHKEYGETPLREGSCGPNAAIRAVGGLVRCLRADHKDNPPKEGEEYPTAEHLQPLYLPSEDLVLLPSDCLVYPDSPHLYDQLVHTGMFKFVISLSQCGDHGEPNGLTLPPRGMGLRLLSQMVTKELRSGTLNSTNLAVIAPHSKLARDLDNLQVILASAEFAAAVRRLHFHGHKCQHGDREEALLQQLQDCEISCLKRLVTLSVHLQSGQVIEGTDSEVTCYIQHPTSCCADDIDDCNGSEDDEDLCCEPAVVCIQAQDAMNDYLDFLSMFAQEIGIYLRSTGNLLPLFQVLRAKSPKEIPGILDKCGISQFHDRRSQPCGEVSMKYGTKLTDEEQLLLIDDPTLPLSRGECVAYKEGEDTGLVTALVLGEVEDDWLNGGPPFIMKWKLRIGESSSDSEEVILASPLQLYTFRKNILLQPERALGGCDEPSTTAVTEEDLIEPGSQQLGLEIEEHRQDICKLVQQAAKLPTEESERLLCRLWKAYHPAKQPSDAHPEYADLFGHLLQCVQDILDGQTAKLFSQVVEHRLVPELHSEADVRCKLLRATDRGRRIRRNGLFSRPEPDEVRSLLRQQFGVAIQHPVSYLPISTPPGPWMGGDWCFVHSNIPGRQQHHHLPESSCANEEIVVSITQNIVRLRQYFGREPLDAHQVLDACSAWSESYCTVKQLLKLSLQCYASSEDSRSDCGGVAEMLECLQPFLSGKTHSSIMDSISCFHIDERSARTAWKATEAVLGYLLDDMKQQSDHTEEQARIVQLLSSVERKKSVSVGDEQEENLSSDQI